MQNSAIAIAYLIAALTQALLCAATAVVVWHVKGITDGPWWIGFLILGFACLCASPCIVIPFAVVAKRTGRDGDRGFLSGVTLGLLYPLAVALLTGLFRTVAGLDMAWDKLVESLMGWVILAFTTLVPGILVSFIAVYCERLLSRGRAATDAA